MVEPGRGGNTKGSPDHAWVDGWVNGPPRRRQAWPDENTARPRCGRTNKVRPPQGSEGRPDGPAPGRTNVRRGGCSRAQLTRAKMRWSLALAGSSAIETSRPPRRDPESTPRARSVQGERGQGELRMSPNGGGPRTTVAEARGAPTREPPKSGVGARRYRRRGKRPQASRTPGEPQSASSHPGRRGEDRRGPGERPGTSKDPPPPRP